MSPPVLVAVCLFITLALPGFAFYVTRRATRSDATQERVRIFQNQWRSPVLNDGSVARRLMDVIAAPAVKQNFQLSITVELDFEQHAMEDTSMVVTVDAKYDFVNVGRQEVILSIDPGRLTDDLGVSDARRDLIAFSVGNPAVPLSRDEHTVTVPVGTRRTIHTTSKYHGGYPYVAMLPQSVPVLGDTDVKVTSYAGQPIAVTVVGRNDQASRLRSCPTTIEPSHLNLLVPGPLLPGDTIMLTVGI